MLSTSYSKSELIQAVCEDNLNEAKRLLETKANINEQNLLGDTPLIIAADHSNLNMVKLLLANGANVNHLNIIFDTALIQVARSLDVKKSDIDIIKLLLQHIDDESHPSWFYRYYYGKKAIFIAENNGHREMAEAIKHSIKELEFKQAKRAVVFGFFDKNPTPNKLNPLGNIAKDEIFDKNVINEVFKFLKP